MKIARNEEKRTYNDRQKERSKYCGHCRKYGHFTSACKDFFTSRSQTQQRKKIDPYRGKPNISKILRSRITEDEESEEDNVEALIDPDIFIIDEEEKEEIDKLARTEEENDDKILEKQTTSRNNCDSDKIR